jgi:microsomal dipeptidase-like Zn-dependent dipeptidase
VICQDVRANTNVSEYVDWVDYCVKLVGVDHVGVAMEITSAGLPCRGGQLLEEKSAH